MSTNEYSFPSSKIIYTAVFGKKTLWAIIVFVLLEGFTWGLGTWWFSYFYAWPLLYFLTRIVLKLFVVDFTLLAILSGFFGLIFGTLFTLVYIPINLIYAFNYWIAGLPWDVWHAISNVILFLVLGKPIYSLLKKISVINYSNF